MSAKADPEALKKNAFWITLGSFGGVWLIAILIVLFTASDKKKKEWEAAEKDVKAALASGPKTEAYLKPWLAHGGMFRKHKDKIWADGWKMQAAMYTWPEEMKVRPSYPDDELGGTFTERLNNRGAFPKQYSSQFADLRGIVTPALFRGGFDAIVPRQRWVANKEPTREEIWLAQESFWVRREMLLAIQDALNASATFSDVSTIEAGTTAAFAATTALPSLAGPGGEALRVLAALAANTPPTAPEEKLPEGIVGRRVFRSAFWEAVLMFARDTEGIGTKWVISPESTIKNINRTRKTQYLASSTSPKGVPFRLIAADGATYIMRIAGEPLVYGASGRLNRTYRVDPVDLKKEFGLQQVLEWETSPIRMIEALEIAAHSHRTITWGFKPNPDLMKLDPQEEPEPASKDKGAGKPSTGAAPAKDKKKDDKVGRAEAQKAEKTRVMGISRLRYMHVTPQCRHMPVAIRLVADQSHIHDVLAAVSNSPLRIQITQVTLRHNSSLSRAEGHRKPGMAKDEGPEPDDTFIFSQPGVGRAGRTATLHSDSGDPGGETRTGGGVKGRKGGPPKKKPGSDLTDYKEDGEDVFGSKPGSSDSWGKVPDEAQLVELSIYGVATLYERFPPRPQGTPPPAKK